ncbi:hypothetical protein C8Q73DRAFT_154453 [Cubamyces lactineus]|nr:hypothetical protein C8Q73DRAFT_154453 [Cubamyces lactineus]
MGRRFQVFLIARVPVSLNVPGSSTDKYLCIGAFYHQWCDRTKPLEALHRFFNLLLQKENAALVRDELRLMEHYQYFKRTGLPLLEFFNPAVPCPYTVSLLSISWTTDLEHQSYQSGSTFTAGLMDARKSCWDKARSHLNDDGICVIDLTVIERPAYCFLSEPGGCILSAYQYLHRHTSYLFTEPEDSAKPTDGVSRNVMLFLSRNRIPFNKPTNLTIHHVDRHAKGDSIAALVGVLQGFWALVDLAGHPLVDAKALREVWPTETFGDRQGPRRLKIPKTDDLPMPLDIVVSLYIGLAPLEELEAIKSDFMADDYPIAIGRAILPPYDMHDDLEKIRRRTNTIRRLLASASSFEFVLEPHYPGVWLMPPNSHKGQVEPW